MLNVAMKMLKGDRAKYVGLLFGITFTSFLVTFAGSYFCGFMTRGFALIAENPGADVWVMDPAVESTELAINIPASALARVRVLVAYFPCCRAPWRQRPRAFQTRDFVSF